MLAFAFDPRMEQAHLPIYVEIERRGRERGGEEVRRGSWLVKEEEETFPL
jgi:hypothetical protein